MTRDEALLTAEKYGYQLKGHIPPMDGFIPITDAFKAMGVLEGYEQGVKIGYEQGRSTNGEKSYEDGVRESADLIKESCLYSPDPCGDCRHCHLTRAAIRILALLEVKK